MLSTWRDPNPSPPHEYATTVPQPQPDLHDDHLGLGRILSERLGQAEMAVGLLALSGHLGVADVGALCDLQELGLRLLFGLLGHVRNDGDVMVVDPELGQQGGHAEK